MHSAHCRVQRLWCCRTWLQGPWRRYCPSVRATFGATRQDEGSNRRLGLTSLRRGAAIPRVGLLDRY
jgi:3'-phosphoadenosine 5'-phosphosulfate sulfotransferase (PAPS reductase)/FAD synthetase